jgi:hypothetical protein
MREEEEKVKKQKEHFFFVDIREFVVGRVNGQEKKGAITTASRVP